MSKVSQFYPLAVLTAAIVSSNVQALEPATIQAGGFVITPSLGLDHRYDTNIFSQNSDEQESWVTVLTPSVQATADLGLVSVGASYYHEAGLYEASSDDNYNDNFFAASASMELNQRNQFDVQASYNDDHEDRGTGFSQGAGATAIEEPDTYEEVILDGAYTYGSEQSQGRLVLGVTSLDKEYTNHRASTRGRDREDLTGSATFYWAISGKTDLLAEVVSKDVDYVNDPTAVAGGFDTLDSTVTKYLVGVTWEATGRTTGTVKVGEAKKNFDDSDREDFSGASWEIGVTWAPKTYSAFSFNTARESRETSGTGSFIDAKTYYAGWQHAWTSRISSNVYYSLDDETYEDDTTGREDETETLGFRVDYSMRRWLDLGFSYSDTSKDSNISQFNYDREQVAFHVLVSL